MVYGVKRSREVEKNEEGCGASVRCHQQVAGDSDESSFCAVGGAKTRLKFLMQTVRIEVIVELHRDKFFQKFRDKREVGNWPVI